MNTFLFRSFPGNFYCIVASDNEKQVNHVPKPGKIWQSTWQTGLKYNTGIEKQSSKQKWQIKANQSNTKETTRPVQLEVHFFSKEVFFYVKPGLFYHSIVQ